MGKRWVLILIFYPFGLFAQQRDKNAIDLEAFVERLFPVQEEDIDYEAIYELLFQLYQDPIDLNKTDADELQSTYLLSPTQLSNLLDYRLKNGPLISIYELQAIPEFDLITIQNLLPFVTIGENGVRTKNFWQRLDEEENTYLLMRHRRTWETRRGFTPPDTSRNGALSTRYLGDPNELYLRFRTQRARDFSLGFTLEKDAGEQFIWDRKLPDMGSTLYPFTFYGTMWANGKRSHWEISRSVLGKDWYLGRDTPWEKEPKQCQQSAGVAAESCHTAPHWSLVFSEAWDSHDKSEIGRVP